MDTQANSETAKIKVALVEDDPQHRSRFVEAINDHSATVVQYAANNGQAMLTWLSQHEPDVLLVDLGLPDIPGLAVITYCVQRWPHTDIAVVTMFADAEHVIASIEAGASGYLLKQTLHEDIATSIIELRKGGSPMSPSIARYVLDKFRGSKPSTLTPEEILDNGVGLSERELQILNLVSRGFRNSEIANLTTLSVNTVNTYIKRIYTKLSVHSKTEAVFEAGRMGLIQV